MAGAARLPGLAAQRPPTVLEGVTEKFKSASHQSSGWVRDAAANYDFGSFGTGLQVAAAALARRAARGEPLRVLDAGCGSGGQLAEILSLVEEQGAPAYLRGVTAEAIPSIPERLKDWHVVSLGSSVDGHETDLAVDLRIYQGFPLEDLASATAADFVREGRVFDLILCSWTLFHLCDPLGTFLQMRQFLDSEGVMLANGAYFYFDAPGGPEDETGPGSIRAMQSPLARLSGLECCVEGGPVRWVEGDPEDPDNAVGEFQGGYQVSVRWSGGGEPGERAEAEVASLCGYTGKVIDKVWHLASGPQYCVASYSLL